jgi:putative tricarboxylic transport membrane protein
MVLRAGLLASVILPLLVFPTVPTTPTTPTTPTAAPAQPRAPLDRLTIVAPAAPGGGWDQTARAMQRVLEAEGLVRAVQVENVPGAAGTVGLARFVNDPPRAEPALLVTGLVMVGAIVFNDSAVSLTRTTPIASLTEEFEVVVVPAASPIRDMRELADRFRAAPSSVSWAGGSAGGTDHILAGLIASAVGVDPARVNYIAFSGGGEALAAVLGGQVTAAISGYSEFAPHIDSGRLRALAISAPSPQSGIAARPLAASGLNVVLHNWRGVVGPPQIDREAREQLTDLMTRLVASPSWQQTLRERGWSDRFLRDDDFVRFLDDDRARVTRIARSLRTPAAEGRAIAGRLFPSIVFIGSVILAVALLLERRRPQPVLHEPRAPFDYRTFGLTALALPAYLVALTVAGFVIASTLLFWTTALAFGSRHRARDGVLAAAFAVITYFVFARGLGLSLPAGWLATFVPWIR